MTYDGLEGSTHGYNVLNRLSSISYGTGASAGTMQATYSSAGEKLAVKTTTSAGTSTTYFGIISKP